MEIIVRSNCERLTVICLLSIAVFKFLIKFIFMDKIIFPLKLF